MLDDDDGQSAHLLRPGYCIASVFKPIPTTIYILAYLVVFGCTRAISHWFARSADDEIDVDEKPGQPAEVATW